MEKSRFLHVWFCGNAKHIVKTLHLRILDFTQIDM